MARGTLILSFAAAIPAASAFARVHAIDELSSLKTPGDGALSPLRTIVREGSGSSGVYANVLSGGEIAVDDAVELC